MPTGLTKEQRRDLGLLFGGALPAALFGMFGQIPKASAAEVLEAANQSRASAITTAMNSNMEESEVILGSVEQQAGGYYSIGGNLNIRSGPGTNYAVVGQYHSGDTIPVSSISDSRYAGGYRWLCGPIGWFAETGAVRKVASGNTQSENYSGQSAMTTRETGSSTYVVNTGNSVVYIINSNNKQVGSLAPGGAIPLRGQSGVWYMVDGGFIHTRAPGITTSTQSQSSAASAGSSGFLDNYAGQGFSGDPTVAFLGGNSFQESGVSYHVTIVRGTNVVQQGPNFLVTLSSGGTMLVPQRVSRIVKWQNGSQAGPGWQDILVDSNWVQPGYLLSNFGWDPETGTLVIN